MKMFQKINKGKNTSLMNCILKYDLINIEESKLHFSLYDTELCYLLYKHLENLNKSLNF